MDKARIAVTEVFASDIEERRKENLQKAVDQYIALRIKNSGVATAKKPKQPLP